MKSSELDMYVVDGPQAYTIGTDIDIGGGL